MEQQIKLMSGISKLCETYRTLRKLNFSIDVLDDITNLVDDLMGLVEKNEIRDYLLSTEVGKIENEDLYFIKI